MKYIEMFLFTNIFILFELTIYIVFFYFKNYYNNNKKNLYEEIFLLINNFLLIFLYYKLNNNLYIFYLGINILLQIQFNKINEAIYTTLLQLSFIYFNTKYNLIFLYILYFIIYKLFNRNKMIITHLFTLITTLFMIYYSYKYLSLNIENFIVITIFIISSYIITFYIINLKRRVKLYLTIKDIEKDKMFKTSIFKVTHEIKNPLAVIKGYLQIFDSNDSIKCERYKNILMTEVNNALLVLKDFSEINNMKINKEYMDFNKLLNEVKETIIPFFTIKRINLIIDSEKDLFIYADYNRLKQVFINILKNSCEALNNLGKINIDAFKNNNKLIISIKDNGPGMTKETIDNLFIPFNSNKTDGTGLGLCLSKEIIEKHNGTIKYYSSLNNYTLVKIIIPCY